MAKFGAKEVLDATLFDMSTGLPVITFDTLKTSDIEVTTEKVYARGGKGNSKLMTWEINKEATIKIEDALLSPKSLELVTGIATAVGAKSISMRQISDWETKDGYKIDKGGSFPLTCSTGGVITLAFTPTDAIGNIVIYKADDDCGTRIDMTGATLSTNVITLLGDGKTAASGQAVVVYYNYLSGTDAETYVVDSSHFAGTYKLVGKTVVRNQKTGKDEGFQVTLPSLKWSSGLTLNFAADGDPSVQTFECEIQKSANSDLFIEMIKYNTKVS